MVYTVCKRLSNLGYKQKQRCSVKPHLLGEHAAFLAALGEPSIRARWHYIVKENTV